MQWSSSKGLDPLELPLKTLLVAPVNDRTVRSGTQDVMAGNAAKNNGSGLMIL